MSCPLMQVRQHSQCANGLRSFCELSGTLRPLHSKSISQWHPAIRTSTLWLRHSCGSVRLGPECDTRLSSFSALVRVVKYHSILSMLTVRITSPCVGLEHCDLCIPKASPSILRPVQAFFGCVTPAARCAFVQNVMQRT